jgi:regulatory protein
MPTRVTSVRRAPAGRWGIEVATESGQRLRIAERRVLELPLRAGAALDDGQVELLRRWERVDRAERQVLNLLGVRARSRWEVEQRLRARGLSDGEVADVRDRLEAAGLLDEEAMAAQVVAREVRAGAGRHRLRDRLERWGVDRDAAAAALERATCGESELERAQMLVRDRFGGVPVGDRDRRRAAALLVRRGFDHDTVEAALGGVD